MNEIFYMKKAISEAKKAADRNEVPVGAVLVKNNKILSSGYNQVIKLADPSAHAEIIAIREAARKTQNYRLIDCHLFVTLEPCLMCAGAIFNSRISSVTYATCDPKTGVAESNLRIFENRSLNHHAITKGGVLDEESVKLLKRFFLTKRQLKQADKK
ncbi:MAG: hypothetical protein CBC01_09250 [Betaproteobacteria bacterium TMED41]|nr:MAG: hypothetical protein CBC01_09250 [Betaproteobacteria bacterium TMED41]|tara:strand:+ start:546 stop:1016 length:471 start_codon:yes stop_codon:yes gene_type:complete